MGAYNKPKLIVLLGPTAVGKTKLSIELAKRFSCEIISGDSMQVYRGMDIGTAKINAEEMQGVSHHCINILDPDEAFSVAQFQGNCKQLIPQIADRGHTPFIVGGTGLYIESVCYEYQFIDSGSDEEFRRMKQQQVDEQGPDVIYNELARLDPESAAKLHPNDVRRVIRALEVLHLTGRTLSSQLEGQNKQSPYDLCMIGLTMDREMLYNRIERRIEQMMDLGLVQEVKRLLNLGYSRSLISMQGLGYKEIIEHIEDGVSLELAVEKLKRDTRRFAKRQLSWFRHMADISWIDIGEGENFSAIFNQACGIIAGKFLTDLEYNSKHY